MVFRGSSHPVVSFGLQMSLFNSWGRSNWGPERFCDLTSVTQQSVAEGGSHEGQFWERLEEWQAASQCPLRSSMVSPGRKVSPSLGALRPRCARSPWSREPVPQPHCLSGFPLTSLWTSSVKWVDARAGGPLEARRPGQWTEPHPLLGWPPTGYSLTLQSPPPFPGAASSWPYCLAGQPGCRAGPGIVESTAYRLNRSLPWPLACTVRRE